MFHNVDWFKFFATGQFRQMAIANAAVMALAGSCLPRNRAAMPNCHHCHAPVMRTVAVWRSVHWPTAWPGALSVDAALGALAGAGTGLQIGNLIFMGLGLSAIAEYFYQGLPACLAPLQQGMATAWFAEDGPWTQPAARQRRPRSA